MDITMLLSDQESAFVENLTGKFRAHDYCSPPSSSGCRVVETGCVPKFDVVFSSVNNGP